jgi:uncharacterized membrane protein
MISTAVFLWIAIGIIFILIKKQNEKIQHLKSDFKLEIESLKRELSSTAEPEVSKEKADRPATPFPSPMRANNKASIKKPLPNLKTPSKFDLLMTNLVGHIVNYFKTGNTIVKVGLLVLFFGVSFLVKFASEQGLLPIEFRLLVLAFFALGLTAFGWKERKKRAEYALSLQGGGIGILFITTFAAFKIYQLIPSPLAFIFLVILSGLSSWLAVIQDSRSLAIFGVVGGFLAPILTSSGKGNHIILFSYYLILNAGIFVINTKKTWRSLSLLGFLFTYVISSSWGILKYQSHHFSSVEPFLILFFLFYVFIPVLNAQNQKDYQENKIFSAILFGNPLFVFFFQTQLTEHYQYGPAISTFVLSLFYAGLSFSLSRNKSDKFKLLTSAFTAISAVFFTITIPLAFNGKITASTWAIEAVGIYWLALRQNQPFRRFVAIALVPLASLFFLHDGYVAPSKYIFANSSFIGSLLIALSALAISFMAYKAKDQLESSEETIIPAFFTLGSFIWIFTGLYEIKYFLLGTDPFQKTLVANTINFSLLYLSLGLLLYSIAGRKSNNPYLCNSSMALPFFLLYSLFKMSMSDSHPFILFNGLILWPCFFITHYYIAYKTEKYPTILPQVLKFSHALSLWALALIGSWELSEFIKLALPNEKTLISVSKLVIPLSLSTLVLFYTDKVKWPIQRHMKDYLTFVLGPVIILCFFWLFHTNIKSSGLFFDLPYISFFNPLEVTHAFIIFILFSWLKVMEHYKFIEFKKIGIVIGLTLFFWLNGVLLRSMHHYANIPFVFKTLFSSPLVQMAMSIYWSVIGISLMIYSSTKRLRWPWIGGGSLMVVVVIKLFLFDLSKSGTIERIVSFITVGIILLIVGYFSPIPPKKD